MLSVAFGQQGEEEQQRVSGVAGEIPGQRQRVQAPELQAPGRMPHVLPLVRARIEAAGGKPAPAERVDRDQDAEEVFDAAMAIAQQGEWLVEAVIRPLADVDGDVVKYVL